MVWRNDSTFNAQNLRFINLGAMAAIETGTRVLLAK